MAQLIEQPKINESITKAIDLSKATLINSKNLETEKGTDLNKASNIISREELLMGGLLNFFGQPYKLNFFKWAIENKVLDYVLNNLQTIVDDMNLRGSKAKKEKPVNAKKELSISATKSVTKHNVVVTVEFK